MTEREDKRTPNKRSFFRTILPYCNLFVAAALTFSLAGVTVSVDDRKTENELLESELHTARAELIRIRKESRDELARLAAEGRHQADEYKSRIETYTGAIDRLEERLEDMEVVNRSSNKSTDESVSAVRGELEALRQSFVERPAPKRSPAEIFRDFERDHREGVLLIYTEFDYRRTGGQNKTRKTVTGWGSGFFISDDGYIATNKHVVQPWKFDADIAAMVALGEIEVIEDSLRIACWQSGTKAFDEQGDPVVSVGYNTWKLKNLKIAALAEDSMREKEMDFGGFGPTLKIHALDNNDLVILKASGKKFSPLPLREAQAPSIEKLDQVMALGFPRGQNGLESGMVESSPSIGTIRKIENTIHVTASIIPGNSGGPLIGPDGRVVGIVTRVYSETLGICLKLEHVRTLLDKARTGAVAEATTAAK